MVSGQIDNSSLIYIRLYHWILCIGALSDWVCAGAVAMRKLYESFPVFSTYVVYTAIGDTLGLAVYSWGSLHVSWVVFLSFSWAGYLLEFGVVFEIVSHLVSASGMLNQIKAMKPLLIWLAVCIFASSSVAGGAVVYHHVTPSVGLFIRLELADGVCRALLFFGVISLGWIPDIRSMQWPLRLAYYLTFYFGVAMVCQSAHEIQAARGPQYDYFERIESVRIAAWIITMALVTWHCGYFRRSGPDAPGVDLEAESSG